LQVRGAEGELKFMPPTTDDPSRRRPDISVAKRELGWQPEVTVDDGLDRTILYFKQELGIPLAPVRCAFSHCVAGVVAVVAVIICHRVVCARTYGYCVLVCAV
jgi:hypothetical protein